MGGKLAIKSGQLVLGVQLIFVSLRMVSTRLATRAFNGKARCDIQQLVKIGFYAVGLMHGICRFMYNKNHEV